MGAFAERNRALIEVVNACWSPDDGGWPHRLDVANAASSIVATAHVLEMLRAWDYEYSHARIQGGLAYLSAAVREHTAPKALAGLGRGEFSRYPAFALWGLTRFPQSAFDRNFREGFDFALRWLNRHQLPGGGWATGRSGHLSFTATMPVVHSLDRLAFHPRYGAPAIDLAAKARGAVERMNRGRGIQAWWTPYGDAPQASAGTTALAVLILAAGNEVQRELARRGISWLLSNPAEWVDRSEPDLHVEDRAWLMMSFSLGVRAVLHPCAGRKATTPVLRRSIEFLDDLWVEEVGAWSHYPGGIPSTTGSFAVIMAVRALKRAFEFDPRTHLEVGTRRQGSPRSRHRKPRPRLRVELRPTVKSVRIWNHGTEPIVDLHVRGESQWSVLAAVAARHHKSQNENDQRTQTIALGELAATLPKSNSPEAAARAVSRVNTLLTEHAWQNHNEFLPALIEDVRPSGSTERRYGLEEVDVTIVSSDSAA